MKKDKKPINTDKPLFRDFKIDSSAADTESRVIELAFSSELPYERWFGMEILDHGTESVRLGRLMDGAPLLLNHDHNQQVGVVESVEIGSDRIGRAKVRFGKGELAEEIFNDVVDAIRQKVSVGYQIHKMVLDSKNGDEETYRVTDWTPFEISIVSIPADNSVGVGRMVDILDEKSEGDATEDEGADAENDTKNQTTETQEEEIKEMDPKEQEALIAKAQADTRAAELTRCKELTDLGNTFANFGGVELSRQYMAEGKTAAELTTALLERAGKKPMPSAELGMSENEVKRFSFLRLMNALSNPQDMKAQSDAGFELELSSAARAKRNKEEIKGNVTIPLDVLKRDLTVGTPTAGGNTVATELLSGSFIDLLRNKLAIAQLGATVLSGLNGNVAIPKQTGAATVYWVAESGAPTESQQTIGQVTLTPKTVGAFTDFSRRLLLQSSIDVEQMVRNDLAAVLALGIDLAAINGSGASNEPTGILNTAGIGSVAGGTNGATVTFDNIIDLETAVSIANADVGNLSYLTNAKQRGVMKKAPIVAGYPDKIWDRGEYPLNGYNCAVSNQVPSNLTKGSSGAVCSAILFGNWSDLLIGMWGGLDLMVDPYTSSTTGTVRIVALQDVDVAVRNAVSFAAMKDAL